MIWNNKSPIFYRQELSEDERDEDEDSEKDEGDDPDASNGSKSGM